MKILWAIKAVNCHGKFHNRYTLTFIYWTVSQIPLFGLVGIMFLRVEKS